MLTRREKTAAANELGTLTHWWKETGETRPGFAKKKDSATLEEKILLSGTEREHWWPDGTGFHELTFALNPFTMVLELFAWHAPLALADEWKKSFDPRRWLTGTIDWLGWGARAWVDDLKTGAWPVDVLTSKQLRSYALVPWLIEGAPDEWACDVSITQWARYPKADPPIRTWHVLTAFDLREHLEDIRWTLEHPNHVVVAPVAIEEFASGAVTLKDADTGKLHPCSGCECREPHPTSEWFTNFWYRSYPTCVPGMLKVING